MTGGLRRRCGALQTVNLAQKLALIADCWSPKAVGEVNGFHVKLVNWRPAGALFPL
jgi:hypothetical protein